MEKFDRVKLKRDNDHPQAPFPFHTFSLFYYRIVVIVDYVTVPFDDDKADDNDDNGTRNIEILFLNTSKDNATI